MDTKRQSDRASQGISEETHKKAWNAQFENCPCGDGPRPGHPMGWCIEGMAKDRDAKADMLDDIRAAFPGPGIDFSPWHVLDAIKRALGTRKGPRPGRATELALAGDRQSDRVNQGISEEDLRRAEWELSDDDDAPDGLSDDLGRALLEGYQRVAKELAKANETIAGLQREMNEHVLAWSKCQGRLDAWVAATGCATPEEWEAKQEDDALERKAARDR